MEKYAMDKFDFLRDQLREMQSKHLLRKFTCVDSAQGPEMRLDGREFVVFCSNNYLNLAEDKRIAEAVTDAVKKFGYGAAASRLISGTTSLHLETEQALARTFNKESALLFPSGWTANEALLRTIPQKGDIVLLDKFDHASIIDAVRASEVEFRTYLRDNLDRLERYLAEKKYNRKFIVTESIFSMDGNIVDLVKLVELKNKYQAILIVDEAHSFGCMGKTGSGLAEELDLLDEVDIVVTTMSKAVGATGGIVAADKVVTDYLLNRARAFIYTTACSPANCAAILKAVEIIKTEPDRREKLRSNARYLRDRLNKLRFDTGKSQSHIIPVIIGSAEEALTIADRLREHSLFVPAIRPPTVTPGSARLRISLQSMHSRKHLDSLCDALKSL